MDSMDSIISVAIYGFVLTWIINSNYNMDISYKHTILATGGWIIGHIFYSFVRKIFKLGD